MLNGNSHLDPHIDVFASSAEALYRLEGLRRTVTLIHVQAAH
jgi:hypothetical protein